MIQLPALPYAMDALQPHLSKETLEFHYGKHHKAYVDKLNEAIPGTRFEGMALEEIIISSSREFAKVFNNAAQIWNHSFFWKCLAPQGSTRPSGRLREMIGSDFGGEQALLDKLAGESVNHFASGWGWLIRNNGKLEVTSLHDADTPVAHGMTPLLTIDVWEHAYYIDYRNERPRYVKSVLENIINWDFVAENLDGQGASRADQQATASADSLS